MKAVFALIVALFGSADAFSAGAVRPGAALISRRAAATAAPLMYTEPEPQDLWWGDKEYPPSEVLGIGANVPSLVYGVSSGLALFIGCYCVAQSNLVNILSGSTVNGFLVFGALILPIYSWGLHVASWIQKQNGK